jgi:hypothetical protein
VAEYTSNGVPMGRHPMALLRTLLERFRVQPAQL